MQHKGFSLVNVLQPCVTFNKVNTYQYYMKTAYKLATEYDPSNFEQAVAKALEMNVEKFPLGIIYKSERPAYHEQLKQLSSGAPLLDQPVFNEFGRLIKEFV
jgi:2-oxoglutarate ferredoxin oxidoreductase subunit beta